MLQSINDLSRSLVALDQNTMVIAVVELSLSAWLVGGMVPGIARDPLKKLATPDPEALLRLLHRWRDEAVKAGKTITRIVVAFEAGRDGFWLARWLGVRKIEAYVIHPTSIAVSREQRRAKTDQPHESSLGCASAFAASTQNCARRRSSWRRCERRKVVPFRSTHWPSSRARWRICVSLTSRSSRSRRRVWNN